MTVGRNLRVNHKCHLGVNIGELANCQEKKIPMFFWLQAKRQPLQGPIYVLHPASAYKLFELFELFELF